MDTSMDIPNGFEVMQNNSGNNGNSGRETFFMDIKQHQFGSNNDNEDLFLSLKCHIDSQQRLIQLYRNRIRSFEIFRKYCQRLAHFDSGGGETIKFNLKQFQNEYNKFDLNYRYFRKRIRNLRKQTKSTLSIQNQNVYDILYDLAAKLESNDNFETRYFFGDQNYPEVSINEVIESTESANYSTINNRENTQDNNNLDIQFYPEISLNIVKQQQPELTTNDSVNPNDPVNNDGDSETVLKKIKQETCTDLSTDFNSSLQKKTKGKKRKISNPPTELLKCDAEGCKYSTTKWSFMNQHKVTHSDERPFKCDKCDAAFKFKKVLIRHQNIHEGQRFWCTFEGCTVNYSTKHDISKHIKVFHTKEAPLIHCNWDGCDYTTYNSEYLKLHQIVHTDQRPYKCPDCEMAFKFPANLRAHKLTHQTERCFKCDFEGCDYASNNKELLQKHKFVHNVDRPFKCDWLGCKKSFKSRASLWKHKAMHENQRRFRCKVEGCEFAANYSEGLRVHVEAIHVQNKKHRIRR